MSKEKEKKIDPEVEEVLRDPKGGKLIKVIRYVLGEVEQERQEQLQTEAEEVAKKKPRSLLDGVLD